MRKDDSKPEGAIEGRQKEPRQRPRLADVAARAGVSPVTASRALRRPQMVSPQLRARVERAVRQLGYVPSQIASALASSRTNTIGVVIPSLTNSVFSDYLKALHDVFLPAGIRPMVFNSRYADNEEERAIATLLGQHPEAMILAGIDQTPGARRMLEECGLPVVQTMELTDTPIDINIGLSQEEAAYTATKCLLALGHRRIAKMGAPNDARSRRRLIGYRRALAEYECTPMVVASERQSLVSVGGELFDEVYSRWPDIDAIFCGSDNLALGALFECQRRGITVPDDLSLIGFNDLDFAATAFPSLTTIATPRYEMARRSAEIVLEVIRGSGARPRETRIDLGFKLVERASTGPRELKPVETRKPFAKHGRTAVTAQ
jgi:LacI family gluconate utilization system Gnt-I transcriptional repressor